MKRTIKIALLTVAIATLAPLEERFGEVFAQQEMRHVVDGNRDYNKEKYTDAELDYRRGIDKNSQAYEARYNLGNSLFRQNKYPEAAEAYAEAIKTLDGKDKKNNAKLAEAYHNLGNACFGQQDYGKAVAAYSESLRRNPKDNDTRYNLVKAMLLLQQQQQQQQQQNENENQNKDQQQQQQQEQQQNQNENQDENQQQQEQQQQQQDESKMDKETAEQILQALEQDEQETQEKMQRVQGSKKRVEKNW